MVVESRRRAFAPPDARIELISERIGLFVLSPEHVGPQSRSRAAHSGKLITQAGIDKRHSLGIESGRRPEVNPARVVAVHALIGQLFTNPPLGEAEQSCERIRTIRNDREAVTEPRIIGTALPPASCETVDLHLGRNSAECGKRCDLLDEPPFIVGLECKEPQPPRPAAANERVPHAASTDRLEARQPVSRILRGPRSARFRPGSTQRRMHGADPTRGFAARTELRRERKTANPLERDLRALGRECAIVAGSAGQGRSPPWPRPRGPWQRRPIPGRRGSNPRRTGRAHPRGCWPRPVRSARRPVVAPDPYRPTKHRNSQCPSAARNHPAEHLRAVVSPSRRRESRRRFDCGRAGRLPTA